MSKKLTLKAFLVESVDSSELKRSPICKENVMGAIEFNGSHIAYQTKDKESFILGDGYPVTLVKEVADKPAWFSEDGEIKHELPLDEGSVGKIFHGCIFPDDNLILTNSAENFKKLLNSFLVDGGMKFVPIFRNDSMETVLNWDYYKKLSISCNFPTFDEQSEFITTKTGQLFKYIDEFGGLKFDATISAPKSKQVLNKDQIKECVREMASNDFCSKLVVKGADFEQIAEQIDIKNDQLSYTESFDTGTIQHSQFCMAIRNACAEFQKFIK